jgi:hypothetical protein
MGVLAPDFDIFQVLTNCLGHLPSSIYYPSYNKFAAGTTANVLSNPLKFSQGREICTRPFPSLKGPGDTLELT